jgi:hypothetical protein
MIGGFLAAAASACAAQTDGKCVCAAAPPSASAPAPPNGGSHDADVLTGLVNALRDNIPRPRPNQFETPESVLQFVFQKIASRDMAGSLVAFPVAEYSERVTLKDYVKYTGSFAPGKYPLDDDRYGRLSHAISSYLATYSEVALKVLSDKSGGTVMVKESNMQAFLHEFDGARLKALQVVAIKNTHPESPPEVNPIDQAMGVTEKTMRQVTVSLEGREVVVTALIGRIADNWRVLFMMT